MNEFYKNPMVQRGVAAGTVVLLGGVLIARCGSDTEPGPGYDVSHPQCTAENPTEAIELPDARSFAIVGLNGGRAKTSNSCFASQMEWAMDSAGDKGMPKAGIYVNSGNPGAAVAREWPQSGEFAGKECEGSDSIACAYQYGKSLAEWNLREFSEAFAEDNDVEPKDFTWWIDVEIGNSWQCNQNVSALCGEVNAIPVESGALSRNAAVIHGMAEEFKVNGINTGIYTVPKQWNLIVENAFETVPEFAGTQGIDVWLAGAANEKEARQACNLRPFGGLGQVVLSQHNSNPKDAEVLDENVVCEDQKEN
jgi:hypothetical protein